MQQAKHRKIAQLEEKLANKKEVIAELLQEVKHPLRSTRPAAKWLTVSSITTTVRLNSAIGYITPVDKCELAGAGDLRRTGSQVGGSSLAAATSLPGRTEGCLMITAALQPDSAWAEDRALLRSNPSAASRGPDRWGGTRPPLSSSSLIGIGTKATNLRQPRSCRGPHFVPCAVKG